MGSRKKHDIKRKTETSTDLVIGDWQIPYHDKKVMALVADFAKDLKPRKIIINGDAVDSHHHGKFPVDPLDKQTFDKERREFWKWLERFQMATGEVEYSGGNHEERLLRYLCDHREVFSPYGTAAEDALASLHPARLLKLKEKGVKWNPYKSGVMLGKLFVTHGDKVHKHSGYTAKNMLDALGRNVLINHVHRLGSHFRTYPGKEPLGAWENGCMCDLRPAWMPNANWQHGFSVVTSIPSGYFSVEQVLIHKRREFSFGGEWIRS